MEYSKSPYCVTTGSRQKQETAVSESQAGAQRIAVLHTKKAHIKATVFAMQL